MTIRRTDTSESISIGAFELAAVLATVLVLALVYYLTQEPAQFFHFVDWDGLQYYSMAEQFRAGQEISAQGPEVYRIVSPFIVSLFPTQDLMAAFFWWDLSCAILATVLLYVWLRLHLKSRLLPFAFTVLAVCTLSSPVRIIIYHLVVLEGVAFLLIMLGFFCIYLYDHSYRLRWILALCLVTAIGAATREACIIPAVMLPFMGNPISVTMMRKILRPWVITSDLIRIFFAREQVILWLPIICGIVSVIAVRMSVDVSDKFSYLDMVSWGFSDVGPLRYFASILNTFGPVILVIFFIPRFFTGFFAERQGYAVALTLFLVMSWSALGDERYFVWVMPIIFLMIGFVLERHFDVLGNIKLILTMIFFELIAIRALFEIVPTSQPMIERPIYVEALSRYLPDGWHWTETHAYNADPKSVLTAVGVNLIMAWVLWLMMRTRIAKPVT